MVVLAGCGEDSRPVESDWTPKPLTSEERNSLERSEREGKYRFSLNTIPYAKAAYQDAGLSDDDYARIGWVACYRMLEQDIDWRDVSQEVADEYGTTWEVGWYFVSHANELCPDTDGLRYMPPKLLAELTVEEGGG